MNEAQKPASSNSLRVRDDGGRREWGRLYPVRADWLALQPQEEILEPALPIIDTHYHINLQEDRLYLAPDFLADAASGHNIVGTVYAECNAAWRESGPEALRPVGETEFVASLRNASGGEPLASGIVGFADLSLGAAVETPLTAHIEAGQGRFRGIRYTTAYDESPVILSHSRAPRGAMQLPTVHEGLKVLQRLGLSFDAWLYFHQLPEFISLADAHPELNIVLEHCGGPLGYGPYLDHHEQVLSTWRSHMREVARRPNVSVKIGGLLMRSAAGDYLNSTIPAGSRELADCIRPYVENTIELFGADRCMFESNFPVDKIVTGYTTLWNAFKYLTAAASAEEKKQLYADTARRVYRLG